MKLVKGFFLFVLLLTTQNIGILCENENEKQKDVVEQKEDTNINDSLSLALNQTDTIKNYLSTNIDKQVRPTFGNIYDIKDIYNKEHYESKINYFMRYKRQPPERRIASIRKRLNAEKKKEEMMAADANPRMEPNETGVNKPRPVDFEYGGVNSEQEYNKKNDRFRKLRLQQPSENNKVYESDIDCNFEADCTWTWRKDVANGFFITSGRNFEANETGPRTDANGKEFGIQTHPKEVIGDEGNQVNVLAYFHPNLHVSIRATCEYLGL